MKNLLCRSLAAALLATSLTLLATSLTLLATSLTLLATSLTLLATSLTLLATSLTLNAQAGSSTGQVDFGQFTASVKGGEFVEIQLKSNLLGIAAQLVGKAEPDAAKILNSVESVRGNVVGPDHREPRGIDQARPKDPGRPGGAGLGTQCQCAGKQGEDVGIFAKTRSSARRRVASRASGPPDR